MAKVSAAVWEAVAEHVGQRVCVCAVYHLQVSELSVLVIC